MGGGCHNPQMGVAGGSTVTLLFTDVTDGIRLWDTDGNEMAEASVRHGRLVRKSVEAHGGRVFKEAGDSHRAVFANPVGALSAAVEIQRAAATELWAAGLPVWVCAALHAGPCVERDGDYVGPVVNRAARLLDAGHGGQVLATAAAYALLAGWLPPGIGLRDLGEHRLRDLGRAERVFQVTGPGLADEFAALRSLDDPALQHNLPSQATSFVGRTAELAELRALVSGRDRLVTIAGPGGIGKSRLALQVAADALDGAGDGAWLVELAPLTDPELVDQATAAVLGVREASGRPLLDTLTDAIDDRDLLVVLDNAEHVLDAVARLADAIIRRCPRARLLVTSREPLGIGGERVFRVPGLTLPPAGLVVSARTDPALADPALLAAFESVQLFAEHGALHRRGFAVDRANAAAVAAICVRLDGIPLALELAAARLAALSAAEINARLDQRFRLLTGGDRAAPPRHQTLQALLDWSYDLLSPAEQVVLERLSVFAGGWTMEAAEAVASGGDVADWQVLDLLTALASKSLVQVEVTRGPTRYRLLETVRHYAAERLTLWDGAGARDAHRDYYLALAETAAAHLTGPDQGHWLTRLDAEQANLRRAGEHAAGEPGGTPVILRLGAALFRYWLARRQNHHGFGLLTSATGRPDAGAEPALLAAALTAAVGLAPWVDVAAGHRLAEQAVQVARPLGDDRLLSRALAALCSAWFFVGEAEKGLPFGQESLALARRLGDDVLLGVSLNHYLVTVEPARGLELVGEAIACTLRSGDHLYHCFLRSNASWQAMCVGDIPAARAHLEAMAQSARQIGYGGPEFPSNMGLVLRAEGDTAGARSMFGGSLRAGRREGAGLGLPLGLLGLAHVAGDLGDWERAGTLHGAAQAAAHRLGTRWYEPEASSRDDSLARARAHLGAEQLARLYARGMALSTAEACDLALAPAPMPAPAPATAAPVPADPGNPLSARERQIIALLAGGASNAAIAAALHVTVNTVRTHLDRIRDKTGARSRADLTRYALLAGIEPASP